MNASDFIIPTTKSVPTCAVFLYCDHKKYFCSYYYLYGGSHPFHLKKLFHIILSIFTIPALSFYCSTLWVCKLALVSSKFKKPKILDHISQSSCLLISQFNSPKKLSILLPPLFHLPLSFKPLCSCSCFCNTLKLVLKMTHYQYLV